MGAIFQRFFQRNLIIYQPEQWSKRLGQQCSKCEKNLTHEKCISLCKCYYFCHEDCFRTAFEEQIHRENTDVRCEKCQADLHLRLNVHYEYHPEMSKRKACKLTVIFLLLTLIVMGIVGTLNSQIRVEYSFFILYLEGIVLSLALYGLIICIRDIFYRKVIKITELGSSKLDIQTSAFKDIEMETNEEITKECLFTVKK